MGCGTSSGTVVDQEAKHRHPHNDPIERGKQREQQRQEVLNATEKRLNAQKKGTTTNKSKTSTDAAHFGNDQKTMKVRIATHVLYMPNAFSQSLDCGEGCQLIKICVGVCLFKWTVS